MEAESRHQNAAVDPGSALSVDDDTHERQAAQRALNSIVENGHRYSFYRLVRILEKLRGDPDSQPGDQDPLFSQLRFRPSESVVFPAGDIKEVEYSGRGKDPLTLVLSFHGLYGFGSPLPSQLTKEIELSNPESEPYRDFLDMFNNRLYYFYYRAWTKYRPYVASRKEDVHDVRRRFIAMAGLSSQDAVSNEPVHVLRLAAFAGQLGSLVRNAQGLKNLIAGCLPGFGVRVVENIPRFVRLSDRPRLGSPVPEEGLVLGRTATIGQRIRDVSGKFRIVLGPMKFGQFENCLPGRSSARRLQYLVSSYVTDLLDYDVELRLYTAEVPVLKLGDRTRGLGLNTWIRRPTERVTSRIVHYDQSRVSV